MARIAIMLNRLVIGGAPLDTVQLAGYLSEKHEVYLVVGEKNKDEYDASFLLKAYPRLRVVHIREVHRSINFFRDVLAFFHIKRELKKINPDIVHTNGAKPGVLGRLAAKMIGTKVILHTYHGHVFHSYFNKFFSAQIIKLERWLATQSTKLIATSLIQQHDLVDVYHVSDLSKIAVIPIGIDTTSFEDSEEKKRNRFRTYYKLHDKEVAIGIVGRIVPIKDHKFFIEAVAKLLQKTKLPVRFFIIGDGALRTSLESQLGRKKISYTYYPESAEVAQVTFTSWLLSIDEAMAGLDIVALTSLNEGTAITLLEAQAAGKPIVTTNAGAVSQTIDPGVTGLLSPLHDLNGFVSNALSLIENKELRKSMGENGRQFVMRGFSKQKELADIERLYLSLLENQRTQ
ncbi:glycosyltransferase [Pinibacter soli]|uniref:Glycosyltransferase n=1 Tax=Pinibacter soli TaxID=3044211 RepID=A0ABT6RBH8_9BACT|nr:glycosyltransferase [Pinibacter soli]MDI3319894.1 glycosyltransferase [Pinibacter soli]